MPDTYIAMATAVAATDEQRELLVRMGEKLCREQGADAVALAPKVRIPWRRAMRLFLDFEKVSGDDLFSGNEGGFPT